MSLKDMGKRTPPSLRKRCTAAIKWAKDGKYSFVEDMDLDNVPDYVFGRPSKYHPLYCLVVLHLGTMGYSVNEIARELKVCRQTTTNWKADYPDFLAAMKETKYLRQAYFETCMRGSASGTTAGNSATIKFALTNINKDEYKNTQVFEGRVDTTVEEVGMSADTAKKLDPKKRREIIDVLNRVSESDTDG